MGYARVNDQEDYFMGGRGFGKLMQTFAAFGAGTGRHEPVQVAARFGRVASERCLVRIDVVVCHPNLLDYSCLVSTHASLNSR